MKRLMLLAAAVLSLCAVSQSQFSCVSDCGSSRSEIGMFASVLECCANSSAGGFVQGGVCSSCLPFQVVNPQLTFCLDPEVPVLGQPLDGTCRVSIDPAVSGMILLEWMNQNNVVISSSTGTTSAETTFTVDDFTIMDNALLAGYSCKATIFAQDGTSQYNITITRSIPFRATPISFFITSSGDVTAGSQFQLTCTVMGVNMYPMIMWFGPGGMIGSSTDEIELGDIVHSGDTYSRTLLFNSLSADQAGNYICFNTATVPPSTDHFVFVANRSISVTDSPTLDRPFTATCEMAVPDSLEATVQVMLFDPAGQEVASAAGLNSAEAVFLIANLQVSDLGEYRCRSTVFSNQFNSPVIAEQTFIVEMFQCEDDSTFCSGIINSECVDTPQGPICVCLRGYMLGLESQCVDIDECELEASSVCGPDAMCVNSEGSYQCIEPPTVVLRNECETGEANCGENAVCTDMEEGFNCDCGEGYEGDGFTCCDINECDQGTANCDEHALCINLPGYYYCICLYGYSGNGSTCNKLEEEEPSEEPDVDCTPGTPRSRSHSTRHKSRSTRHSKSRSTRHSKSLCPTPSGGDDEQQEPEVEEENRTRTTMRKKTRTRTRTSGIEGSANNDIQQDEDEECTGKTCRTGSRNTTIESDDELQETRTRKTKTKKTKKTQTRDEGAESGDDDIQQDEDEECTGKTCRTGSRHTRTGSRHTTTGRRRTGTGRRRTGTGRRRTVELCEEDSCSGKMNTECVDTAQGPICVCLRGYMLGLESQCVDVDECVCPTLSSACSFNDTCVNTEGSYLCIGPPADVQGDCEIGKANCECTETEEGFRCGCSKGYQGNGFNCSDIDECDWGTDNCDKHAVCINLQGSFLCRCRYGYFGNGFTCKKLEEEPSDEPSEEPEVDCTPGTPRSHSRSTSHTSRSTSHTSRSTSHTSRSTSHMSRSTSHTSRSTHHTSHPTSHTSRSTSHTSRSTRYSKSLCPTLPGSGDDIQQDEDEECTGKTCRTGSRNTSSDTSTSHSSRGKSKKGRH